MSFRRVSVRYQTLDLQILCSKALSLGQRNSEESLATTRLTYNTCPTYCLDQQCQKGNMFKQNEKDRLSLLPSPDSCDLSFELQKISEEGTLDVLIYT